MALNIFEACKILKPKKIISVGSACSYPGQLSDDLIENKICEEEKIGYIQFNDESKQFNTNY